MKERKLPSRGQVVFYSVFVIALLVLGGANLRENFVLRSSRHVAIARIIDSQIRSTKFGMSYEIQYTFQPSPGAPSVGRVGWLRESNLWSTLPEEEWQKAVKQGEVEVRFDPANAGNNAPAVALPSLGDDSVPVLLGLFLAGYLIVIEVKKSKIVGSPVAPTAAT